MHTNTTGQPAGGAPGSSESGATNPTPAAPAVVPGAAAPETTPAPVAAPWKDVQGVWTVGEKPWWDGISEAPVKELMEAKKYANPHELALAYFNANKLVSGAADAVVIPKADAPPEAWADYKKKMGVPEKPEMYEFKHKEGVKVDPAMEAIGRNLFHKMMASPAQAQIGVDAWNDAIGEYSAQQAEAAAETNDRELKLLEEKWGAELKANLAAGNEVLKVVGISEDLVARVESKIGSAAVVELLAMIGRATPGGSFKGGGSVEGEVSGEAVKSEIAKLQADPAYFDKNHPQHKDLVARVANLFTKV